MFVSVLVFGRGKYSLLLFSDYPDRGQTHGPRGKNPKIDPQIGRTSQRASKRRQMMEASRFRSSSKSSRRTSANPDSKDQANPCLAAQTSPVWFFHRIQNQVEQGFASEFRKIHHGLLTDTLERPAHRTQRVHIGKNISVSVQSLRGSIIPAGQN